MFQFGFSQSRMSPSVVLHSGGYAVQASFVLDALGGQLVSSHHECTRGPRVGIHQGPHRRDPVCLLPILLPDGRQTRRDAGPVGDFHGCPLTGTMEQQRGFA